MPYLAKSVLLVSALCVCRGAAMADSNIVPNGDFSKGNTGFTSQLPYVDPAYNCLWEGKYTIAAKFSDPQLHRLIAPESFAAKSKHTGKEKVLFANAGGSDPLVIWATTVKCKPNTRYRISFDCISLTGYMDDSNPPHQIATMEWVPDFEISANGRPSAPIQAGCGKYAHGSMTWDSGKSTTADLQIVRTEFPHGGGIIGICNIEMAPLPVATTTSARR